MSEQIKNWIDLLAISTGIAVFVKWIPPIAGLFSIFWLGTQLYDYWIVKRRNKHGDERIK